LLSKTRVNQDNPRWRHMSQLKAATAFMIVATTAKTLECMSYKNAVFPLVLYSPGNATVATNDLFLAFNLLIRFSANLAGAPPNMVPNTTL
jgi:hypothetical protein